jgi:UDP-N-acetylglucosamine transferase subunit ALG13
MILVTVGTHPQGFERLVQPMDELAAELGERVVIQYGSSRYRPRSAEGFDFTSSQEMERLTGQARVVVCHAAAGSILLALRYSRPVVAVPRLKRYGEVVDDHQLQLARALEARGQAQVVYEISAENLKTAVLRAGSGQARRDPDRQLVKALQARLEAWERRAARPIEGPGQEASP